MAAELSTVNGILIRRLGPGHYVREDEWVRFTEFNESLHLSYMINNSPFDDLPIQYIPIPDLGHRPPTLRFGFAIPGGFDVFRQAALKNKLKTRKVLMKSKDFSMVRTLVLDYLNQQCGLPPVRSLGYDTVYSKEGDLVLVLKTNYGRNVPKRKVPDVTRIIKELFELPNDAKPKWYIKEYEITQCDPDEFILPSHFTAK